MAETSTAISLVTSLIQGLSISTTNLKPPPPDFRPEPFKVYLADLNLAPAELATIPDDVLTAWHDHIYRSRNGLDRLIPTTSLAGQVIAYATPHVRAIEEKAKLRATELYEQEIDEVDRSSLTQILNVTTWAWKGIGSYITHNLMEGAFLGQNEQMRFDLAARFSYLRMMHHATKVDAFRELALQQGTLYFVRDRIPLIQKITQQQSSKHNLWRYRWMTSEKVNLLDVSFSMQLKLYGQLIEEFTDKTPIDQRYLTLLNYHRINSILTELKAAYFNHMVEIKPHSWLSKYAQIGVNYITDAIAKLDSTKTEIPRHFLDVYKDTLQLNWDVYDHLFPHTRITRKSSDALSDFMAAIADDNFILAKWITLGTETPDSNFNWFKEAGDFENYKRGVDRLIHIQNHIDDLITALHSINDEEFRHFIETDITSKFYQNINIFIYRLWDLRNKIDELRILYRTAYLKSLKTTVNEADKGYWERLNQTLKNKAIRKIVEGQFFDTSETKEQVLMKLREFQQSYTGILSEIGVLISNTQPIKDELLSPIDRGDEFYPVFYTFDEYVHFFDGKAALTDTDLKIAQYNLKRIASITTNPFWKTQLDEIQKLAYVSKELTKATKLAEVYYKNTKNPAFSTVQTEIKGAQQTLGVSYLKYIQSEWNRLHPVNTQRLLGSAGHKFSRLVTTGQLLDSTKEFKDIYPDFIAFIDHITKLLVVKAGEISEPFTTIRIGTVYVKVPQAAPRSARDARKERRSTSLMVLESSAQQAGSSE